MSIMVKCRRRSMLGYLFVLLLAQNVRQTFSDCDWKCDDGNCLESESVCNGVVNCADGSDEIAENCIQMPCPHFAFRCMYGACIAGTAKCNGRQDCADGSDEHPAVCEKNKSSLRAKQQGLCADFQVQCTSGECIDEDVACNGHVDCADGSDETLDMCVGLKCQGFAFQCGYGACIAGTAKCNTTEECADGSDEAWGLCNRARGPHAQRPTIVPKPKPTPTTPVTTPMCSIPADRTNVIMRDLLRNVALNAGSRVAKDTIVSFTCQRGYTLEGDKQIACTEKDWYSGIPTCTKYCDETYLSADVSTNAVCYDSNNRKTNCRNIKPGFRAEIGCAHGFSGDSQLNTDQFRTIYCTDEYRWDRRKMICENMECGRVSPQLTKLARNGQNVNVTEAPWHVGIYISTDEERYTRLCGGSIISPHLVLTAAHCFEDEANTDQPEAKFYDKSLFRVAAGKYYPDYDSADDPFTVQKSEIKEIIVNDFSGLRENYHNDFAIVVLKTYLRFTESIRPICIDFHANAEKEWHAGYSGFIVGWGTNKNSRVEILQKVHMLSLSHRDCDARVRATNPNYKLPDDQFCVVRIGSTGDVCQGDSGGGFVYKEVKNGVESYKLLGIISHAPDKVQDCGRDGLVTLSNVEYFESEIKRINKLYIDRIRRPN